MPQRKDKSDKAGHQDSFLGLLNLLESPEPEMVESVKNMIHENLSSSRDSKLLNNLVDFYVATQSKSSFEILLHVKDPHDKHLFEKINEMMKNETTRYNALQLLGSIVYKQPTWLHKISGQRLMHTLIDMLKNDMNCPNLLSGLFILICLIPMIPHLFGPLLNDTFEIFSRLASWNFKKPSSLSDILNLHLQTGIYSLFHRLYGLFPCNFLAYLRSYYGGRDYNEDKYKVFSFVIKPMLERVQLHPLLVTASKEAELNPNRWKRMAYHDIIVECASISLDRIEGTFEHLAKTNISSSNTSEKISSYESSSSVTFICQDNASAIISTGLTLNDNATLDQDHVWSPSQACTTTLFNYSSNPASPTTAKSEWDFKNVMQSSTEENIPLDFAIEAKPELLKSDLEVSDKLNPEIDNDILVKPDKEKSKYPLLDKRISSQKSTDSDIVNISSKIPVSAEVKEDDVDKEVSELTSGKIIEQNLSPTDIRHDTPFCHTTQNLTDEPANFAQTSPLSQKCDSLVKNDDVDETYCSMQESDLQSYIPNFSRYRYFSQCGPPPDLPMNAKKPKASRSHSCPPVICLESEISPNKWKSFSAKTTIKSESETACSNSVITTTSAFESLNNENSLMNKQSLPIYRKLLPTVVNPLQGFDHRIIIGLPDESAQNCNKKILSPPELLDYYIQQGNAAYIYNLPSSSGKDTDWIRFGDMPPSDKIDVLRNQILLLHNMLLFERHRKDIHSERNRRILGRAKRAKMQEEYVDALKTEISILIEENANLNKELSNRSKMYQKLQNQVKQSKEDFDSRLYKNSQRNAELLYSNKQLQTLLVSQKEEINEINELYKKSQSEIALINSQLKYASMEMQHYQKVRKEAIFLTKQLILLQELNAQYKIKIEQMKEPQPDVKANEMNKTLFAEIKDLNRKLDTKTIHLDSARGKISELENILSKMKRKQREETGSHEKMKSYHQAEMTVRDERLMDLKKISSEKDAHILRLYAELEELKEKIESLSKKECHAINDKFDTSGHNSQLGVDKNSHQQKEFS